MEVSVLCKRMSLGAYRANHLFQKMLLHNVRASRPNRQPPVRQSVSSTMTRGGATLAPGQVYERMYVVCSRKTKKAFQEWFNWTITCWMNKDILWRRLTTNLVCDPMMMNPNSRNSWYFNISWLLYVGWSVTGNPKGLHRPLFLQQKRVTFV